MNEILSIAIGPTRPVDITDVIFLSLIGCLLLAVAAFAFGLSFLYADGYEKGQKDAIRGTKKWVVKSSDGDYYWIELKK